MKKNGLSYILCFLAYTIFGFSFLFSKTALNYTSPITLLAVRFTFAFVVLNLLLLTKNFKISLKGKPVWKLLIMGIVQPIIYFICETYGINLTSSAFAGLMLGLVPVAGLITGMIFLKEKGTAFQVFCAILSVIGVALTTIGGTVKVSLAGTVLLLGAVISTAIFTVISRSVADTFTPFERTYVMMALSCIFFVILSFVQSKENIASDLASLMNVKFLLCAAYLAIASSVCAFIFINYSLNHISVGTVSIISNFCTVVSIPAGIFIMHDSFSLWQIAGVLIILASVFGVSVPKKSKKIEQE